jgi:hypothetical protein
MPPSGNGISHTIDRMHSILGGVAIGWPMNEAISARPWGELQPGDLGVASEIFASVCEGWIWRNVRASPFGRLAFVNGPSPKGIFDRPWAFRRAGDS